MSAVDDYLDGVDAPTRAALERVRRLVKETVPEAEEGTSYGMPALKYRKKPLLGFIAAKEHLSIFPFSPQVIDNLRDRLNAFALSKGTIRFSLANQIPDDLLVAIVTHRRNEIAGIIP